jgi:hypothetical protein
MGTTFIIIKASSNLSTGHARCRSRELLVRISLQIPGFEAPSEIFNTLPGQAHVLYYV